jgi:hypothetical protein
VGLYRGFKSCYADREVFDMERGYLLRLSRRRVGLNNMLYNSMLYRFQSVDQHITIQGGICYMLYYHRAVDL